MTDTIMAPAAIAAEPEIEWDMTSPPVHVQIPAFYFHQGTIPNYSTTLTVNQLLDVISIPNPDAPFHGNRKVDRGRARKFGQYVSDKLNGAMIVPGLILQVDPDALEFTEKSNAGNGSILGLVTFTGPARLRRYVDGQHRGLGFYEEIYRLGEEKRKNDEAIHRHQQRNQEIPPTLTQQRREVKAKIAKIGDLTVPIQVVSTDEEASRMLFVDVNDKQVGVRKDFRATLDQRISTNQIAADLASNHVLLQDRIETGQSRAISPTNENWLGMETLAKISRFILRGGSGRFGERVERETLANVTTETPKVEAFFDALGMLSDVQVGIRNVPAMRDATMLGMQTTIIVLAAAWHKVGAFDGVQPGDQMKFLRWVEPMMRQVPIVLADNDPNRHPYADFWKDKFVQDGNRTFTARQGDINGAATRLALAWREADGRKLADHAELYG